MSLNTQNVPDQGGAVTFWRLDAQIHLQTLKDGLEELGLGYCAPSPRTNLSVLKEAITDASKRLKQQYIVVAMDDKSGFALVKGHGGAEPGSTWGMVDRVIKLTTDGTDIIVDPHDDPLYTEVGWAYKTGRDYITAPMAGKALVDVCKALNGACLRPAGGIYWLHEQALDAWGYVAKAFDKASPKGTNVYLIRHKLDFDSVKAVYDGILAETETALAQMKKEILSGELGDRALEHREMECKRLADKLSYYETVLGASFELTKKLAVEMTDAQAFAVLHQQILQPDAVAV